ncbi:MAG: endonuclease domain-containing protein [Solirubrobacterales bacterium]
MLSAPAGWIEVSIPSTNGRKRRRGIILHRSASLAAGCSASGERLVVERESIPCHHARAHPPRPPARGAGGGGSARLPSRPRPAARPTRRPRPRARPDTQRARAALPLALPAPRLPRPEVNARLGPYEVDFLWREHRLVVEADSWRHHSDRAAFEADRIRDTRLQAAGYRVLRLTHRRLRAEPAAVAASLRGRDARGGTFRRAPNGSAELELPALAALAAAVSALAALA